MEEFVFASSSSVKFPVYIRIGTLEGFQSPLPRSTLLKNPALRYVGSNQSAFSDLYVTVQLWSDSKPLTQSVQTSYKAFRGVRTWNEWLELPFSISQLPLNSQIAITVWDLSPATEDTSNGHHVPFGGATLPLFDKDDTLHKGRHSCRLYKGTEADGYSSTKTPGFLPQTAASTDDTSNTGSSIQEREAELERLEGLVRKHHNGEMPRVDWLDALVFQNITKKKRELEELQKIQRIKRVSKSSSATSAGSDEDWRFTLMIDLPRFDLPIVFTDFEYKPTPVSAIPIHAPASGVDLKPPPEVQYGPGIRGPSEASGLNENAGPLIRVYDPEVGLKDNPAESKHRRLVRSHRTSLLDRDLKPNAKIRDELNTIMSYGPTQVLNGEETDLVWKFRHHLTREKRALTKFVKSVSWSDPIEARQAIQLLPRWTQIDVDDALELLGPSFENPAVRAYAVDRLRKADDEELLMYLLQLVQALKFEKISLENESATRESSLASFLISRATRNIVLGNYLHWYLVVECDDDSIGQAKEHRKLFQRVEFDFMTELEASPGGSEQRKQLLKQGEMITVLTKLCRDLQKFGLNNRQKMIEHLKKYLGDSKNDFNFDPPLPLPLDPSYQIVGTFPDESNVFKSSLTPMLINFKTVEGKRYPVLFKAGDDLRQDQLVLQIISLMDRLLRNENLDLKLTPYRILATSPTVGAVQFIPSVSLQSAKNKFSTKSSNFIQEYLKVNSPDKNAEYGIRQEAMENYVKSCAGYCVVTYLLGVGDRHLDNLLLSPDGHFFHIDFGYMLGRDPKPAPPPIKITQAMVDGMGGLQSKNFDQFRLYASTAFTTLRKQSSLILNLFALMTDANIPDIRAEPDKVVEKVRERFALEMSEEEAIREFDGLIHDSLRRVIPYIVDWTHDLVQRYRG